MWALVSGRAPRVRPPASTRPSIKSDAGNGTLPLPVFAVHMPERRATASGGTGPFNLSQEMREAGGSGEFSWVTSHVFRKTCATQLDEGELSARQI